MVGSSIQGELVMPSTPKVNQSCHSTQKGNQRVPIDRVPQTVKLNKNNLKKPIYLEEDHGNPLSG